jgi:gamma-glutamyltranspeptidase/glutathione hydrolase
LLRSWPCSSDLYLPVPTAGATVRNRDLAATYRRIIDESRGGSRAQEIERARRIFRGGFIAEAVHRFSEQHDGLLTGDDLVSWSASFESPITFEFRDITICKPRSWSQGAVFLQQLALLDGFDLSGMGFNSLAYVHTVAECAKLAFADRDALYGDPDFVEVPLKRLMSADYNDARRRLVTDDASRELRPGDGFIPAGDGQISDLRGAGEPSRGDTVHLDVVDGYGNVVSATPSGGWLQSSPAIDGLGFPLGTRAQMFWLNEDHPNALAPGKRPRTTLSPSLAVRDGEPYLAFGTPGGDQQDQWALNFFLAHTVFGLDLQAAIDAPIFHIEHFPSSFYPRSTTLNVVEAASGLGRRVIEGLEDRGHEVRTACEDSLARLTAAGRQSGGVLVAAVSSRGPQAYAVGR